MILRTKTAMKLSIDGGIEETFITEGKEVTKETYLRAAKQKMDQIREENERLKLRLSQVIEDYHSLKTRFNVDKNQPKTSTNSAASEDNECDFVSLSLGRLCNNNSNMEDKNKEAKKIGNMHNEGKNPDGLELGLDCKFHSDNSADEILSKSESVDKGNNDVSEQHDMGSPKNSRSRDDEILQRSPNLKKPRVSVRAFCNTQTMNDGCQWRKYGQKIAKGNPCPRAYYRCTVSSTCPVRKQVQRCIDDMTILTTTYEGTHNHPLPPSATSMASTTSAAAAMLTCNSSSTTPPQHGVSSPTTTPSFNFTSSNGVATSRLPHITISSTQSHPTVILDLTMPNQYSSNSFPHNNKFSSSLFSNALSHSSSLSFATSNSSFDPNNPFIKNMPSRYSQPFALNDTHVSSPRLVAMDEQLAALAAKAIIEKSGFSVSIGNKNHIICRE